MIESIGTVKFDKQSGRSFQDDGGTAGKAEEFINIVKAFIKGIKSSSAQSLEVGVSDIINMFETFIPPKKVVEEQEKAPELSDKDDKEFLDVQTEVESDVEDPAVHDQPSPDIMESNSEAAYDVPSVAYVPSATLIVEDNNLNVAPIDSQSPRLQDVVYEEAIAYLPASSSEEEPVDVASDNTDYQLPQVPTVLVESALNTSREVLPGVDQSIKRSPDELVQVAVESGTQVANLESLEDLETLKDVVEPILRQRDAVDYVKVDSIDRYISEGGKVDNLLPQHINALPERPEIATSQEKKPEVLSGESLPGNIVADYLVNEGTPDNPLPIVEGSLQVQALIQNLSNVINRSQATGSQGVMFNNSSDVFKDLRNIVTPTSQTVVVLDKSLSEVRPVIGSGLMGGSHLEKGGEKKVAPQTQIARFFPKMIERIASLAEEVERSKDGRSISIRIDPPHLGKIKVDMTLKDGSVHTRLTAESALVAHFLRERGDELQALIRKALPYLDQATISFSMVDNSAGDDLARNSDHSNYQGQDSFSDVDDLKFRKGVLAANRNLSGDVKGNDTSSSWIA